MKMHGSICYKFKVQNLKGNLWATYFGIFLECFEKRFLQKY
jgi:hypothetical protein